MFKSIRKRFLSWRVLFIILVLVACSIFCGLWPNRDRPTYEELLEQNCDDFVSGQVPRSAQIRFLDGLFKAVEVQDDEWLATVSDEYALKKLDAIGSIVTSDYEIVSSDDLAGLYEYRVRFDNGSTVFINLWGVWPTCPDPEVTDQEIFTHLKLSSIWLESK